MDDLENNQASEYEAAFQHGKNQQFSDEYKGLPLYLVPDNMKLVTPPVEEIEKLQERPYGLRDTVETLSADSFVEYYNRFATEYSTIFVDPEAAKFEAILDYHEKPDTPAWKRHRATYACPKSKEWGSWIENNNKKMNQEDFALFIEDNLKEIIEPNGAEMLEIAASLKAKNKVDFKSAIRLDNGQVEFTYQENIDGQAGVNGRLGIPEKITLALKPFLNGAPYEMEARFRYRITPNGLVMWYTLIRPHAVQQHAVDEVVESVTKGMSKGQMIHAKAPR